MVAITLSRKDRKPSRVRQLSYLSTVLALGMAMSRRDDIEKLWKREDLSLKEKLEAYLDGYMMSFDMYPVCERHLFARNDAHALLKDFFAVGQDVNKALQRLFETPDQEFSDTGLSPDDIRRRRIEVAKRTLAALERATTQIERASNGGTEKALRGSKESAD